jgi:hypothetical protein
MMLDLSHEQLFLGLDGSVDVSIHGVRRDKF